MRADVVEQLVARHRVAVALDPRDRPERGPRQPGVDGHLVGERVGQIDDAHDSCATLHRARRRWPKRARELIARAQLELPEHMREMAFHGSHRYEQGLGDLAIGETFGGELGDAPLARRQRLDTGQHDPPRLAPVARSSVSARAASAAAPARWAMSSARPRISRASRAAVAPDVAPSSVSERASSRARRRARAVDRLPQQLVRPAAEASDAERDAERSRRAERAGERQLLGCEPVRRVPLAERQWASAAAERHGMQVGGGGRASRKLAGPEEVGERLVPPTLSEPQPPAGEP